ncbi:hypothetical protein AB751O23_AB_00250 [Chlamydiales bacterium SCGC AB-751-O23]|jgi:16S rRNA (uracil1498-N3)-methyltransferase|nr:hypothetical protein AB751O23_AB_00250 [Chlamydiales bacterium SCGC AB-751-O23]
MPAYRFFHNEQLIEAQEITIEGKELHHLCNVMKLKESETLELVNGRGCLATATLIKKSKKKAIVQIDKVKIYKERKNKFSIIQGFCKEKKRLHLILEKACEIGVDSFYYFCSEKGADLEQVVRAKEKLQEIAVAAMKQSGRLFLPKLKCLNSIKELEGFSSPIFYGSLSEDSSLLTNELIKIKKFDTPFHILIGPESGLSKTEENFLESIQAKKVNFNTHTLRTETAAIVSLGIISHHIQSLS